ncbi:4'-phosphopantetheinyl transferase family protein [Kytococcus sp. Marseille-QA3725]
MPEVHLARTTGDAEEALLALATAVTGVEGLTLTRACPRCGSDQHGRPVLLGTAETFVSLSRPRTPGPAVVAVCVGSAVGVDVENAGAAAFEGFDDLALHPRERCADDDARTRLWVRKEALLKAHGTGLSTDPRAVWLGKDGTVRQGPDGTVVDLEHDGQVVAVAVTPPAAVRLVRS